MSLPIGRTVFYFYCVLHQGAEPVKAVKKHGFWSLKREWDKERHGHGLGSLLLGSDSAPLTSSCLSFVTAFLLQGCLRSLSGQFRPIIYLPNLDLKKGWKLLKSGLLGTLNLLSPHKNCDVNWQVQHSGECISPDSVIHHMTRSGSLL